MKHKILWPYEKMQNTKQNALQSLGITIIERNFIVVFRPKSKLRPWAFTKTKGILWPMIWGIILKETWKALMCSRALRALTYWVSRIKVWQSFENNSWAVVKRLCVGAIRWGSAVFSLARWVWLSGEVFILAGSCVGVQKPLYTNMADFIQSFRICEKYSF